MAPIIITRPFVPELSYFDTVMADSPTGYWRLGETSGTTAFDSSGNGYDGTYVNGPTNGSGLINDPNGSKIFNGTNQYVTVPDNVALQPGLNASWTVECWTDAVGNDNAPFVAKRQNGGQFEQYSLGRSGDSHFSGSGSRAAWLYAEFADSVPSSGVELAVASSTTTFNPVGVKHVVGVVDFSANDAFIYINGVEVAKASVVGQIDGAYPNINNTDPLTFMWNNGSSYHNASLDEVAIYNYALSPSRILAHYNAGT